VFEHDESITAICLNVKKSRLIVGDQSGTVGIWSLENDLPISQKSGQLALSP
jgi:hypothetical protein